MGMEAGPGAICARCYDDVWRLSDRGWCDQCVLADLMRRLLTSNLSTVETDNGPRATVRWDMAQIVVDKSELRVLEHVATGLPNVVWRP